MSELLLLIHSEDTTTGTTVEWCLNRGVDFKIKVAKNALSQPEHVSSLMDHRGLIVFGGDMEAWETKKNPWLLNEKILVKQFIDRDRHIMGLCLGAQLMAEQSGGKVFPDPRGWELGWIEVSSAEIDQPTHVLAWHSSTFEVGPSAKIIAHNQEKQNAAFRISPKAVGFQVHMEVDDRRLAHALAGYDETSWGRIQTVEQVREGFLKHHLAVKAWYFDTLDKWWTAK